MCSCDNTDTFTYDDQELLSQVRYGAGGSSTMTWDADQQRQKLTNSGGSTYFVYDPTAGVPAVLVETDGENETFYVREPGGELIARATGQTRQYYFFDRLGSTVAMVPAVEGNPTDRLFYTPWGELMTSGSRASTVGTTANPYRYVGQLGYYYHHQDAGLQNWMQLGVRFYEPEIGRFERRDWLVRQAEQPYTYVSGHPLQYVDASGLLAWEVKNSCSGVNPSTPSRCGDTCQNCCNSLAVDTESIRITAISAGLPGDVQILSSTVQECQGVCEDRCREYQSGSLCMRNYGECLFRTVRNGALLGTIQDALMQAYLAL